MPALSCRDSYYLPEGIVGFEQIKGLRVRCVPSAQPFFFLEAVGAEPLCFPAIDPFLVYPAYEPALSANDLAYLQLEDPREALFICLVNWGNGPCSATVNLRGPLALNREQRQARQVDCGAEDYPLRFALTHVFQNRVSNTPPTRRISLPDGTACTACFTQATA
jgi:flagellar assembly factor FliW